MKFIIILITLFSFYSFGTNCLAVNNERENVEGKVTDKDLQKTKVGDLKLEWEQYFKGRKNATEGIKRAKYHQKNIVIKNRRRRKRKSKKK